MKKVFITYSHTDKDFVEELKNELELSDVDVSLDTKLLAPGDSLLKIFEEIGICDFLLPVLSLNSISSDWVQKELETAIVKEIEEKEFKVVPVIKDGENWQELKTQMPGHLREALRSKYLARFDTKLHADAVRELLKTLSPEQDPQEVYAEIYGARSDNPFRRVRTEYFEDVKILARSFTEPESILYDRIMEVKPTLIEGGRGSGKTMLLKSLEARVGVLRTNKKTIREAGLDHFGAYCRLTQGAFATQEGNILNHIPVEMATRLFGSELILQLSQSLVEEIHQCSLQEILNISANEESLLVGEITKQIKPKTTGDSDVRDLGSLKRFIQIELRSISEYVGRKIFGETPTYDGVFLDKSELGEICGAVSRILRDLPKSSTIYFLLDEYENLLPFQKVVLNTLVKWAKSNTFTIKIATKKTGFQAPRTLEGQELEEGHDYSPVDLDYDLSDADHRNHYKSLLTSICRKVLVGEKYKVTEIGSLLEPAPHCDGADETEMEAVIAGMVKEQSGKVWAELEEQDRQEYRHRLEMGALYRVLKRKKKLYAGFDDFTLLSSGIIRYFLELCGMSYYFAAQAGARVREGEQMRVEHQNEAAYTLSSYYLATIRKNIVDYGPQIQQLTIDLGDIFRQKLLHHLSEPEAARVAISDPHLLQDLSMKDVKVILDVAVMHSVLQLRRGVGGIRPKHVTDVQPKEYLINRIYAPELKYSPRPRWRTDFETRDLSGLLDPSMRKEIKTKLIRRVASSKERKVESKNGQAGLFGEQPKTDSRDDEEHM